MVYINTILYDYLIKRPFFNHQQTVILIEMIIMGLLKMVSIKHHLAVGVDVPINYPVNFTVVKCPSHTDGTKCFPPQMLLLSDLTRWKIKGDHVIAG